MTRIDWQEVQVPFGGGLDLKSDPRLVQPPNALVLKNVVFDENGGYQVRNAFSSVGSTTTHENGTSLSAARKIVAFGDELLLFTKDALYTWNPQSASWTGGITYFAPKINEKTVFTRSSDQTECDRIDAGRVVVYTWTDTVGATSTVYVAAVQKTTGAVLLAPTSVGTGSRPKLVWRAAGGATSSILLFAKTAANTLSVKSIDPSGTAALLASSVAASWVTVSAAFNGFYDVALSASAAVVVFAHTTATTYGYASVTFAGTPVVTAATKGRAADTAISCAVAPDGRIGVFRNVAGDLKADILTSAFVDAFVNVAVGTLTVAAPVQIACEFSSIISGGEYTCYVFWSFTNTTTNTATLDGTQYNLVTTAGAAATSAYAVRRANVASRAFNRDGNVYVWLSFAKDSTVSTMGAGGGALKTQLQNTYFLYRNGGDLIAKAAMNYAGGHAPSSGHLPGVQVDPADSDVYVFCGTERRLIPVGGGAQGYADRGPREIRVEFDSDEARRCVRLGKTLYLTGGQILQWDGEGLAEVGFHIYPWCVPFIDGGAGNLEAGDYYYKETYDWINAKGELDRSTTATIGPVNVDAGSKGTAGELVPLHVTRKSSLYSRTPPAARLWRTKKNPTPDSPFYLVTGQDPAVVTGANCYVANDHTASWFATFDDAFSDATLETKETDPETGNVLEHMAPPAATIALATTDRLVLAGIAHDPLEIWYSRQRGPSEVASFHDGNIVRMPPQGGDITGLGWMDQTIVVFKERAVFILPGDGFDNAGQGQNFGAPQVRSYDIGATSHDLIALTDRGLVFFSEKGWKLLDRSFNVQDLGAPVRDYDTDSWKAIVVLEKKQQLRCVSASRVLLFDTEQGKWAEWEESGALSSTLWDADGLGQHLYITTASVYRESSAPAGNKLIWKSPVYTGEVLLGCNHFKEIAPLGEYRSAHDLKIELFKNFETTAFQTKTWTVSPTTAGGPEIVRHRPSTRKMAALQIQITAQAVGTSGAPVGEGLKLSGLTLKVGRERGLHRVAAAQKQ